MNKFGLVTVSFNETLFTHSNTTKINSTVLEVNVAAVDADRDPLLGFTWKVDSFQPEKMRI